MKDNRTKAQLIASLDAKSKACELADRLLTLQARGVRPVAVETVFIDDQSVLPGCVETITGKVYTPASKTGGVLITEWRRFQNDKLEDVSVDLHYWAEFSTQTNERNSSLATCELASKLRSAVYARMNQNESIREQVNAAIDNAGKICEFCDAGDPSNVERYHTPAECPASPVNE